MSHSIRRRGAALFMTTALAALALASAPAQAADVTAQNIFSLSQAGGGKIALDGGMFGASYTRQWDQTSQNYGTGITCFGAVCRGSSETLNTTGSVAVNIKGDAYGSTATMDFTQGTTAKLSGSGKQFEFTTTQSYAKGPTFKTASPLVDLSVSASLNYKDSVFATGCAGSCAVQNSTLFEGSGTNAPIFADYGGGIQVGSESVPFLSPPFQLRDYRGSFNFASPAQGLTSAGGTQTQAQATSSTYVAGSSPANLLILADGSAPSGTTGDIVLRGNDLGAVVAKAGSAALNVTEYIIQTATMTVTHTVKTFFEDAKSKSIELAVHLAGAPAGTYITVHEVKGEDAFTLGDGVMSLAGDRVVTATTYDVAFDESFGVSLVGDLDLQMFMGQIAGKSFGPLFSDDISTTLPEFTFYDHVYHEHFTTFTTLTIPDGPIVPPGGVPEPATWALMMLGFGGMGLMLRRRPRIALAA